MTNSELQQPGNGGEIERTAEQKAATYEDTISLLDLIAVLAKRWKFIFFSTLIAAILVVGYSLYTIKMPYDAPFNKLVNVYKPEVLVRLQEDRSSAASVLGGGDLGALAGLAGISGVGGSTNVALAEELLKNNTIVDRIVEEFNFFTRYSFEENPAHKARGMVKGKLGTDYNAEAGILTISYTDRDPELAADIVNHAVNLLEERFQALTMAKIQTKKEFIEERLEEVERDLKKAQQEFIEFQIDNGIVNVVVNEETGSVELLFDRYIQPLQRHTITLEYFGRQRDKSVYESLYKLLMSENEKIKLEEMDNSKTFQVLEIAEVPVVKTAPSRGKICIITTIAAFFLSIFLSFIFEYFAKAKQDPEESKKLETIRKSFWGRKKGD